MIYYLRRHGDSEDDSDSSLLVAVLGWNQMDDK